MTEIDRHIIAEHVTLLQAMERINTLPGGKMTLRVIDAAGVLVGTLTDGDIRRA